MRKTSWLWLAVVVCCGCGSEDEIRQEPLDFAAMSDSEKVVLIDQVPIGATAADVRERIPTLPPLKRYVTDHLQQTMMPVTVFDVPATLTFNFEDSVLYGYYFYDGTLCWPTAEAESLFDVVSRMFSSRHGAFVQFEEANHPYDMIIREWDEPEGFEAGVTMSLRPDSSNCLAWGYQRPTP